MHCYVILRERSSGNSFRAVMASGTAAPAPRHLGTVRGRDKRLDQATSGRWWWTKLPAIVSPFAALVQRSHRPGIDRTISKAVGDWERGVAVANSRLCKTFRLSVCTIPYLPPSMFPSGMARIDQRLRSDVLDHLLAPAPLRPMPLGVTARTRRRDGGNWPNFAFAVTYNSVLVYPQVFSSPGNLGNLICLRLRLVQSFKTIGDAAMVKLTAATSRAGYKLYLEYDDGVRGEAGPVASGRQGRVCGVE